MSTKTLTRITKKVAIASTPEVTELYMTGVAVNLTETPETSKKTVTIRGYDENNREIKITIPLKKAPANLEKLIPVDDVATITRGNVIEPRKRLTMADLFGSDPFGTENGED